MKYYTVYEKKTDAIVAFGTAHECSKQLGIKTTSFYYAISRQKTGRVKRGKYHIVAEDYYFKSEE